MYHLIAVLGFWISFSVVTVIEYNIFDLTLKQI